MTGEEIKELADLKIQQFFKEVETVGRHSFTTPQNRVEKAAKLLERIANNFDQVHQLVQPYVDRKEKPDSEALKSVYKMAKGHHAMAQKFRDDLWHADPTLITDKERIDLIGRVDKTRLSLINSITYLSLETWKHPILKRRDHD